MEREDEKETMTISTRGSTTSAARKIMTIISTTFAPGLIMLKLLRTLASKESTFFFLDIVYAPFL